MTTHTPSETAISQGRVRTIVTARWLGVVFGLVQVLAYRTLPYPEGVREVALGIVAAMALSNIVFEFAHRRATTPPDVRRVALAILVVDVLALSGLTWVYAFDSISAIFAILFLVPIEGAVLFGLPGAMWTWGGVAVLYVGREFFAMRYDDPFEPESVSFRLGLMFIVALIVGLLVRDLVSQRRATASALQEAERLDESRTRLISMLAHDVRAPIAATRTALDTLRLAADRIDAAKRDEIISVGQRQADRALLLARDLLDLARVEAGTLTLSPAAVRLDELTARVRDVLAGRVDPVVDVGDLQVWADPVRLEQVLFNLLDNAGKHGRPPVEVRARAQNGHVVIEVRDHGGGVPDEVDLFKAFSHAGEGSVGLGMWIVQQLVGAMDGSIGYRPADPGARFLLRLPAVPEERDGPAEPDEHAAAADDQPSADDSSSASGTTSPVSRS